MSTSPIHYSDSATDATLSMNFSFPSNGLDENVVYHEEDPILFGTSKAEDFFETDWFHFDESNEHDNTNNEILSSEEFEMGLINLSVVSSSESQNNDVQ